MSEFVVSARKYRPQKFDEVVGQQHIAATLKNALSKNQLAHAFLFCGPRGVGKTTCARILAKVLNCSDLQNDADPCNQCSSCQSFNDNASFNILELDAASNNSVEHIRTLTEQVRFQPQQGKYKIFIIDEVHMLSNQAFNAFLKTLEEPPPYAIFILATTEKHKIIPTILSRCQIFDFKRIQVEEIKKQLQYIAKAEGISTDKESLQLIAQKADGAMRDALSIYDKIASSTAESITYKDVIENLNILDYDYFFKLTNACLQEDLSSLMLTFSGIIRLGFDPELCLLGLAEHMRELLMCKDEATMTLMQVSDQLKERYSNQAKVSTKSFLLNALNILNQADINFPRSKNKILHAEIAISKICFLNRALSSSPVGEKKTLNPSDLKPQDTDNKEVTNELVSNTVTTAPVVDPVHSEPPESNPISTPPQQDATVSPPANDDVESPQVEKPQAARSNQSSVAPAKAKKTIANIPSFDIGSLANIIRKEEKDKQENRRPPSQEEIEKLWNEHVELEDSASIKGVLKRTALEFTPEVLKVFVPNALAKDMVQQETALVQKIRDQFDFAGINIEINVDVNKFPDQEQYAPKKVLTNKDKYQEMATKNPAFEQLKEKFDLVPDSE